MEALVHEVGDQPGYLPLLSHALAQTWERREGSLLTLEGYVSTGGVKEALARSADRLYEQLPGDQQNATRSIMLRLVVITDTGEPLCAPVPRPSSPSTPLTTMPSTPWCRPAS